MRCANAPTASAGRPCYAAVVQLCVSDDVDACTLLLLLPLPLLLLWQGDSSSAAQEQTLGVAALAHAGIRIIIAKLADQLHCLQEADSKPSIF